MSDLADLWHRAPDSMRRAITELQALYGVPQAPGPGVVDVRSTGAKGDGVADDTAAIQAAISQAPDGGTVLFPFGNYRITRQLVVTGKRLTLMGQSGAVITEGAPITGVGVAAAMILVSGSAAAGSVVSRLECHGAETLAGFSGAVDRQLCFVRIEGAEAARVHDLVVRDKTYGILVSEAPDTTVTDVDVRGFVTTQTAPGKNYNAAVLVMGGSRVRIARVHARETGSVVIVGGSSSFGIISDCTGVLLKDNGIYVSIGTGWTVSGVKIDQLHGTGGSGIRMRGNGNSAIGCTVANTVGAGGISVTGTPADSTPGQAGCASMVVGNSLIRIDRFGILTDQGEGFYPRDCIIAQNSLTDCARSGSPYYPISVHGSGHRIIGNTVSQSGGDGLGFVGGVAGQPAEGILVSGNLWRGPAPLGVRIASAEGCVLSNNSFMGFSGPAIDLRLCRNTSVFGNTGGVINWDPAFRSQGGQCFGNSARVAGDVSALDPLSGR